MTPEQRAAQVRLVVLDVDGVLTDGRLYYGPQGEALKVFDVRDGHGIKMLLGHGIDVAILSARDSPIVAQRARELGITRVLQGRGDKSAGFRELLDGSNIAAAEAALATLPMVQAGLIAFDLIPLAPYPGFARLFGETLPTAPAN